MTTLNALPITQICRTGSVQPTSVKEFAVILGVVVVMVIFGVIVDHYL